MWCLCSMLLLWAGCWLGSTLLSFCGTETSAEVSSSCLKEGWNIYRSGVAHVLACSSLLVLLDLRKLFHMGQTQASDGDCEEQEQGSLLDRTPTPTSVEVRGKTQDLIQLK